MKHLLIFLFLSSGAIAQDCIPISWAKIDSYDCGDGGVYDIVEGDTTFITISDIEGSGCTPCASASNVLCGDVMANVAYSHPVLLYLYDYIDISYHISSTGDLECNNANNDDRITIGYEIEGEYVSIISLCGVNGEKEGTVRIQGTQCEFMNLVVTGGTSAKSETWHIELTLKGPRLNDNPKPEITEIGTDANFICTGRQILLYCEGPPCSSCSYVWTNISDEVVGQGKEIWYTPQSDDDSHFELTVTSEAGCSTSRHIDIPELVDLDFFGSTIASVCTTMGFVQNYQLPHSVFGINLYWEGNYVNSNRFNLWDASPGIYNLSYKSVGSDCLLEGTTQLEVIAADLLGTQDSLVICSRVEAYELPILTARAVEGYWLEVETQGLAITGNTLLPLASEPGIYRLKFIPDRSNYEYDCVDATLIIEIVGVEAEPECSTTLPLQWHSFTAERNGNHNKLEWRVSSESEDETFTPYYSEDGISFVPIDVSIAKEIVDNQVVFTCKHELLHSQTSFYKIASGVESLKHFSPIVTVNSDIEIEVSIYPNPVAEQLKVVNHMRTTGYEIYRPSGHKVDQREVAKKNIDVSRLQSGFYYIRVFTQSGNMVFPFIKM